MSRPALVIFLTISDLSLLRLAWISAEKHLALGGGALFLTIMAAVCHVLGLRK